MRGRKVFPFLCDLDVFFENILSVLLFLYQEGREVWALSEKEGISASFFLAVSFDIVSV